MRLEIHTDGACSGNPGPGGIGVVIRADGQVVREIAEPIGECTNNIAEYTALIRALEAAREMKADDVLVNSDSELMCRQLNGQYKVKEPHISRLVDQVKQLSSGFASFNIRHVRREANKDADRLSRLAISKGQDGRPAAAGGGEESPSSTG